MGSEFGAYLAQARLGLSCGIYWYGKYFAGPDQLLGCCYTAKRSPQELMVKDSQSGAGSHCTLFHTHEWQDGTSPGYRRHWWVMSAGLLGMIKAYNSAGFAEYGYYDRLVRWSI